MEDLLKLRFKLAGIAMKHYLTEFADEVVVAKKSILMADILIEELFRNQPDFEFAAKIQQQEAQDKYEAELNKD